MFYNNIKYTLLQDKIHSFYKYKNTNYIRVANTNQSQTTEVSNHTDLCRTVPLPADGRDATALPGLRAAPTDVELADAGCEQTQCML